MHNGMRLSTLTRCILLATSSFMAAGQASAATPVVKDISRQVSDLTLNNSANNRNENWNMAHLNGNAAVVAHAAANHNVYFSGPTRDANDRQELIVAGTQLGDHYINLSTGGAASVYLLPGSKTDMIEAGDRGKKTDITVVLDNAMLNGQQNGLKYDDKPVNAVVKNKDYMQGSAIWQDPEDNGELTVSATHKSIINGSIDASGTGNKNILLDDSLLTNGTINLHGNAINSIALKNSQLDPYLNLSSADYTLSNDAIYAFGAKENHVSLDNSTVLGDITLDSTGDTDLFIAHKSLYVGDIFINAGGKAAVDISDSQQDGVIKVMGAKGASVFVTHNATYYGRIYFGSGKNLLTVSDNSGVYADVMADTGSQTDMVIGDNSTYWGKISGVQNLSIGDKGQVVTSELKDMHIAMNGNSALVTTHLNHSVLGMNTSDRLVATKVSGANALTVTRLSKETTAGNHALTQLTMTKGATVKTAFGNGQQAVSARSGAYNDHLALSTLDTTAKSKGAAAQQELILSVKRTELASDVKSAIAGLDGAKASAAAVTDSIANRLNVLNAGNLFYGVREGASLWGDYLYQDANLKGNTDAHSTLQGLNSGADWTWKLGNGSSVTTGLAIGQVKNKLTHVSIAGDFNNHVTGNFYSLYGGWQQALQNRTWSLFTNANLSYGQLRYSASSNNVGDSTTGLKEHLNSGYKGNVLRAELRSGVNILLSQTVSVQPYALLGMDKATADAFANSHVKFARNHSGSSYAGIGTRLTGKVEVKSIKLMPWADVSYTQEFHDNTAIKATSADKNGDYQLNAGKIRKVMTMGAGLNAAVTHNLNLNSGVYTHAGDIRNDVSVRLGVNYSF